MLRYNAKDAIAQLKETKFYKRAVAKHREHARICEEDGAPVGSLGDWAVEIMNALEQGQTDIVESMLAPDGKPAPYEPFQRYSQYDTPAASEITLGFSGKAKK